MKEFENWQKKRCVKTIGYLTNMGAFKAGEKEGWQAALEWALKQTIKSLEADGSISNSHCIHYDTIKEELKEN